MVLAPIPVCPFFASTETEALPETPATLAVIVPVPAAVALKLVGLPGLSKNVPSLGETAQVGITATALPKRSLPAARTVVLVPTRNCALLGETMSLASAAGLIVSTCFAPA
jgi:hypothetical protein